jgi:DNA replication protein DnaC
VLELPPLPSAVRVLRTDESDRLNALYTETFSPRNCVTCSGRGTFRWLDPAGEPADWKCSCEDQYLLYRWLLNAGIEKSYQRLSWTDATGISEPALDVAGDYVDNLSAYTATGVGLVFWGTFGTGKSMLAALLLKSLLVQGADGFFTTFHSLLDAFTEGWNQQEGKRWFEHRIRHAGVLVIDDIGREYGGRNAVAETALDHVLRARVAGERPTIITSNRSLEDMGVLYSGNALSLLSECSIVHQFTGADFRPQQRERKVAEAKLRLVRPITVD